MIAKIETTFKCDYETVVKYLKMSKTLDYIAFPILIFDPVDPQNYPGIWENGDYEVKMKLFKFIPFGKQNIGIELVKQNDPTEYILRDNGTGDIIKKWDHWIFLKKSGDSDKLNYVDRIDIQAGFATLFIWIFANFFYRWRQFRWKRLIKKSFRQLET